MAHPCELCHVTFSRSNDLARHLKSNAHQIVQTAVESVSKQYRDECADLVLKNAEIQESADKLAEKITELERENRDFRITIENLEDRLKFAERVVEKSATRATTVNNIKNTKTTNVLNLISSEPIDMKTFQTEIPKLVTVESVLTNDKRFNNMIHTSLLQDENGKDKVVCTDMARKHFQYLDESTGNLVSDPSLERLIDAMKKGVDYKRLSKELLEELNAIGGDPSENRLEAQRLMKRARFGSFPTHMARKTYRKTLAQIAFDDRPVGDMG